MKITNSKKKQLVHIHKNNYVGDLYDAYKNPSRAKRIAWENILNEARELKTLTNPKVNTFNTFSYSVSFEYLENGIKRLRYYTSHNTYDFEI